MKKYLYLSFLLGIGLSIVSCEKETNDNAASNSVYGIVTDKTTGDPLDNTSVELRPEGLKTLTGSDGSFEFDNVKDGTYRLFVTKSGYNDYTSDEFTVSASNKKAHSIQLEKLPGAVTVVDDNKNEITTIDFGADEGVTMRSFNIFNNSGETLDWEIQYQCEWIENFSEKDGTLRPNVTRAITVKINRSLLKEGENSTAIHIISSNNGSRQITIKATSSPLISVETLDVTEITSSTAIFNGKISSAHSNAITGYGFVYSTKPSSLAIESSDCEKVSFAGSITGSYDYKANGLKDGVTYYVKAYANAGDQYFYGATKHFTVANPLDIVETIGVTDITPTSAVFEGKLNATNIEHGFVYVTGENIDFLDLTTTAHDVNGNDITHEYQGKVTFNNGTGSFTYKAENLESDKTYYMRAYARTSMDEYVYGATLQFSTEQKTPEWDGNYYIKHPWGDPSDEAWSWKKMSKDGDEFIYEGLWGGIGANINKFARDDGALWFPYNEIDADFDEHSYGMKVRFTFNPTNETLKVRYIPY